MPALRNLPHITSMAFNTPLLLEPAYARVFFCALAHQMGIGSVREVGGDRLYGDEIATVLAEWGDENTAAPRRAPYQVSQRIAVIPVDGTLVNKAGYISAASGMTGYNVLVALMSQAMRDPDVDGVLLDMDTPGGTVAGAFDCADMIARMRDIKPIWSLANDMHCSAGQLIASAANRRLVTQTGYTGSVGVMMAHRNYEKRLEKQGVEITLLHSGARKVEGNEYETLPQEVRDRLQKKMDATRQQFAEKVSLYTGLSVEKILATEAAMYSGAESVAIGLADEVVLNTDAVSVMREALNADQQIVMKGAAMTTKSPDHPATENTPSVPDVQSAVNAAVTAENQRIMGILGCEEGKGREALAQALAATPGMTVEDAKRLLDATPLSAQSRTETGLDELMATSPAALSAEASVENAVTDLMNIPV